MEYSSDFNSNVAYEAVSRVIGEDYVDQIEFCMQNDATDYFCVSGEAGEIEIQGTNPAVMLTGLNWYLKYEVCCHMSWNGDQLELPNELPAPQTKIYQIANVPNRFALNDTDDGYTQPYADWEYWEEKIDLLAFHGVNEVLVLPGQEAVYYDTFQEFGYFTEDLLDWIPLPAHQPWWLMQNMSSYPYPLTKQLLRQRVELGNKISDRLRELGMTPVFPGYFGTVPPEFEQLNQDATVIPQGDWVGFKQPDWLDPTCNIFSRVAEVFYEKQSALFGETEMFKMDLLHEAGHSGHVNVGKASKAVQNALKKAHPNALWAILGWQENPDEAILEAVNPDNMLILDGLADRFNDLNREQKWNTPYAFGSIWNFGGHTTMGANMSVWNTRYWNWLNKDNSKLQGIAIIPEASDNNPVAFDFLSELAWREKPVDLKKWFEAWSKRRYGIADQKATEAWNILRETAYNMSADGWSEAQEGLFGAVPDLDANKAATWSPAAMRYDEKSFACALSNLLEVDPSIINKSTYKYDLMDVARQIMSNQSRRLLPKIKDAFENKNKFHFKQLTEKWLNFINLQDSIAGTNQQTMLGPWMERAASYGGNSSERDKCKEDILLLLTCWGHETASNSGLNDYGNRGWQGLTGSYYYRRWEKYFATLLEALENNTSPSEIDWYTVAINWINEKNFYPIEPYGDVYTLAERVQDLCHE